MYVGFAVGLRGKHAVLENWMSYDGCLEDENAVTDVDVSWHEMKLQWPQRPYLLRLTYSLKDEKDLQKVSALQRYRIEKHCKKITARAAEHHFSCVGVRRGAKHIGFFFYGRSMEHGTTFAEKSKVSFLECTYDIARDPEWHVYLREIYPTPVQMQTYNDRLIIERMLGSGDDPKTARRFNHHIAFPNELLRIDFECEAKTLGFAIGTPYYSPERTLAYGSTVHNRSTLDFADVNESTSRLVALAAELDGIYEYWDCPIQRKRR